MDLDTHLRKQTVTIKRNTIAKLKPGINRSKTLNNKALEFEIYTEKPEVLENLNNIIKESKNIDQI